MTLHAGPLRAAERPFGQGTRVGPACSTKGLGPWLPGCSQVRDAERYLRTYYSTGSVGRRDALGAICAPQFDAAAQQNHQAPAPRDGFMPAGRHRRAQVPVIQRAARFQDLQELPAAVQDRHPVRPQRQRGQLRRVRR